MSEDIPKQGVWYELYDFSDRDYGSDWGYIIYVNGVERERHSGFSKIRWAGDAAREAKKRIVEKEREEAT